jgi:hypothetical protein
MSQAVAAAGMDRLPWLPDEPSPPRRLGANREIAGWAVAAALFVAGASYWMGAHSWQKPPAPAEQPSTTVPLPQLGNAEPIQPQVAFEAAPESSPAAEREVSHTRARVERRAVEAPERPTRHQSVAAPIEEKAIAAEPTPMPLPRAAQIGIARPLTLWPATQSQGAYGRIVRIGAFGSRLQAKLGWRYMVQAYPAVAHLPAAVVESRNSRGRPFYRFQIGTTSQAHSEVLCQRMDKIRLSCAVVGLPWRPAGVER